MTAVDLRSRYSTFTYEVAPSKNYWGTGYLFARTGTGTRAYAFVWVALPFTRGVRLKSAKLRLYTRAAPAKAGRTVTVRGFTTASMTYDKTTWANQGTHTLFGPAVTANFGGAVQNNEVLEFDVTPIMQMVSDGQAWYGLRIETNDSLTGVLFQSPVMGSAVAPQLVLEWYDSPLPPDRLSPAGGRVVGVNRPILRFDFEDYSGNRSMASYQVITATNSTFTTGVFDTGEVVSGVAECDLNDFPSFTPPATGVPIWWRVRVKDGDGLWSNWSTPAQWSFKANPTLTLSSPSTAGTVTDPTPPVVWTYSGSTPQSAYRVNIWRWENSKWVMHANSGKVASSDNTWTPPNAIGPNGRYRAIVDVWDSTLNRESVPNSFAYATTSQEFTYKYSTSVASPTNGGYITYSPYPKLTLTWNASITPDRWYLLRDGKPFASYTGADLFRGGTSYSIPDQYPAPRVEHTYSVIAVQNGVSSQPLLIKATTNPVGTWIGNPETSVQLCIVNDKDREISFHETSQAFYVADSMAPVVITSGMTGYEGTLKGQLRSLPQIPNMTAYDWKQVALKIKADVLGSYHVVWGDESFPVVLTDVQVYRSTRLPNTYEFSAKFYQQTSWNYDAKF